MVPQMLSNTMVHITHRLMELDQNRDKEHTVATHMAALQKVYLHEPNILNATEKPSSFNPADRLRRVDSITHWVPPGSWDLKVGAVWEVKRPNATPAEIEICEGQVFDACERSLAYINNGQCYGFSGFGSFWRVFLYKKPGKTYTCLTGEGPPLRDYYVDISDPSDASEAWLIDSCLRDLREHMRFPPDAIRPDVEQLYPPPPTDTTSLCWFYGMKRDGWRYEHHNKRFIIFRYNQWEYYPYDAPVGLM